MKNELSGFNWRPHAMLDTPLLKMIRDMNEFREKVIPSWREMEELKQKLVPEYAVEIQRMASMHAMPQMAQIVASQNELQAYIKSIKDIESLLKISSELPSEYWTEVTVREWELTNTTNEETSIVAEAGSEDLIIVDKSKKIQQIITDVYRDNNILYSIGPREFEEMIAELLRQQGFEVNLTKQTRDGGYDIIALQYLKGHHPLKLLVECKRYAADRPIGIEIVRSFKEVIAEQNANRGIIAATSYFTKDAKVKQSQTPYLLDFKDKDQIIDWVENYNGKVF